MEFQEFLRKQEEVYSRFRDTSKIMAEGTKPSLPAKPQGGYLIVFRHSIEISQEVERFSRRISQAAPAIVYDAATVHTTISDFGIKESFIPEADTLAKLCNSVRNVVMNRPTISYGEWLFNQNTVLVAGMPNQAFLEVVQNVHSSAERNGVQLRMPWGAHITANRFTQTKNPTELSDFFKLMKEAPKLGESEPEFIDVGYFEFNMERFLFNIYERFSLK